MNESKFPPLLPQSLQHEHDMWVGSMNPYNPQLEVSKGPDIEAIKKAFSEKMPVKFSLTNTLSVDEYGPGDDLGEVDVDIIELHEDRECGYLHFLATGELPYVGKSWIWIWEYDDMGGAGADVLVLD